MQTSTRMLRAGLARAATRADRNQDTMQQPAAWRLVARLDTLSVLSRRQQQPQRLQQVPHRLDLQLGPGHWEHQGLLDSLLLLGAATRGSWQLG